jgi:hypothetical protein
MPPCRAAVYRAVKIFDGGITAVEENLRVSNLRPFGPRYFLRRRSVLKISFYFFMIHRAKLLKKPEQRKGMKDENALKGRLHLQKSNRFRVLRSGGRAVEYPAVFLLPGFFGLYFCRLRKGLFFRRDGCG